MENDKCDFCALKVIFDQKSLSKERKIEDFFNTLRSLQKNKIIEKGYERRVSIGDNTGDNSTMCSINSPFFLPNKKNKKCPDFILKTGLTISDALSIYLSKKNIKLASKINYLTWAILILTALLVWIGYMTINCQPK